MDNGSAAGPGGRRRRHHTVTVVVAVVAALLAAVTAVDLTAGVPGGPQAAAAAPAAAAAAAPAAPPTPAPAAEARFSGRFRLGLGADGVRLRPDHQDLAARTMADGPLLLFLPATRARPSDYTLFLQSATDEGYHVLGLDYWNLGRTLSRTCGDRPRCYTRVQRNRFEGVGPTRLSAVTRAGSILDRTRRALEHLRRADPAGGWGRFLRHGDVRWSDVVVAGHSQGGSMAAYIGHVRAVRGVLMFGAPAVSDGTRHAAWIDRPGRTPAARMYALAHVDDGFGPAIRPSWVGLALAGADAPPVTLATPPTGDPHVLLTTVPVPPGARPHGIVVSDRTPRDALGAPVLLPIWRWMLTRALPVTHTE